MSKRRELWNVAIDHDVNDLLNGGLRHLIRSKEGERGCDMFIECYTGVTEWTYIDDDDETQNGTIIEPKDGWASFAHQITDCKLWLVRELGHDVQDSRLHTSNHRGDRYTW